MKARGAFLFISMLWLCVGTLGVSAQACPVGNAAANNIVVASDCVGDVEGRGNDDTLTVDATITVDGNVDGGAGNDTITNNGQVLGSLVGGGGNDSITNNFLVFCCMDGGAGNDTLVNAGGLLGDMLGGGGNDSLLNTGIGIVAGFMIGGAGDDFLQNDSAILEDMRGNDGNDTLINNGFVGFDMRGGDGNDSLTNTGDVSSMLGNEGDDTLINSGFVDFDMRGGDGNDSLVNTGDVLDSMLGNEGDDTLINSGFVDFDMRGGDGNDSITTSGMVGGVISGGAGNDTITLLHGWNGGADNLLFINGGADVDTLVFAFTVPCNDFSTLSTLIGTNVATGSLTTNGQTLDWNNFEQLVNQLTQGTCSDGTFSGILRIDARINLGVADWLTVVFNQNSAGQMGFFIYAHNTLELFVLERDLPTGTPAQDTLIRCDATNQVCLYKQRDGLYRIETRIRNAQGIVIQKTDIFLDGIRPTVLNGK